MITGKTKNATEILIVEDSLAQAENLKHILEEQGHRVVHAMNGKDALAILNDQMPDLIISDIIMPEMDGFELCSHIKADERLRSTPVILLTSLSNPKDVIRAVQCGADQFVTKPYDRKHLLTTIGQLLHDENLHDREDNQKGIHISYRDEEYLITSNRRQILNLLLSTYETAMAKNLDLISTQDELKSLNDDLEEIVDKRTAALHAEIAERKRAEEALKEALERLHSLAANVDSMYLVDRDCTYVFMNAGHLKRFGLSLEEVTGRRYREFHSEEDTRLFAEQVNEVCETCKPITKEYRSARDGTHFLRTFTPIIGQDKDGIILQIAVIAKDITTIKLTEEKLQDTLETLRKTVGATIQVIASTVEVRDPYTSGHQIRSADLARAIATEMGLSPEKIKGIRMAGSIHDLGKISIPAEILSKPTKLSDIEFALIKEHARKGYEMLKDVESPWPLAEIVYQHHERMDGSGYPRNLKGEEICMEARILAVADVVEAMASHRPYRPGLGIEAALKEIEKNSGVFYDNAVADACLRLFREKGFKLEGICYNR
jgi:PAS domain S-box-containing protein